MEWSRAKTLIYSSGMGSSDAVEQVDRRNRALQGIKERKEGLDHVINLLGIETEKDIEKGVLTECKADNTLHIIQRNEPHKPRLSFSKVIFETHIAKEIRAFAFLDRGKPFEYIQAAAVSGYTAGKVRDDDGCLNRNLWTSRVMKQCKVIGRELERIDQYEPKKPPGTRGKT